MMKFNLLVLGTLLMGNVTTTEPPIDKRDKVSALSTEVQEDIRAMEMIIAQKLEKAEALETKGKHLLLQKATATAGRELLEEAELQRMMTLKYRAAIACRTK